MYIIENLGNVPIEPKLTSRLVMVQPKWNLLIYLSMGSSDPRSLNLSLLISLLFLLFVDLIQVTHRSLRRFSLLPQFLLLQG